MKMSPGSPKSAETYKIEQERDCQAISGFSLSLSTENQTNPANIHTVYCFSPVKKYMIFKRLNQQSIT